MIADSLAVTATAQNEISSPAGSSQVVSVGAEHSVAQCSQNTEPSHDRERISFDWPAKYGDQWFRSLKYPR
jgi:hypothetical protein